MLTITARGKTIFRILEFTMSTLSSESHLIDPKELCNSLEEELPAACIAEAGYYDLIVKMGGDSYGVVFAPCTDRACASLVAGLLLSSASVSTHLGGFRLLLILPGTPRPLEKLSWFSVETWIAGVEPNAESVANIIRDVARESEKLGLQKCLTSSA